MVEGYRRIRNTLRFLLANTADFDRGAAMRCPVTQLLEIDRYALAQAQALADAVARRLRALRVPPRRAAPADLLLGGPRRLLPRRAEGPALHDGADSRARRSAQTALALIRDALLKLMAPILSFTAEEAWRIVHPRGSDDLLRTWADALPEVPDAPALLAKWQRILAVRAAVQKELEAVRAGGRDRLVAAGRGRDHRAPAPTTRRWRRWATTCASC